MRVAAKLVFEPMSEADLAGILELERLASPSPWPAGLFLHELQLEFSRLMLARESSGGTILGYACWWEVAEEVHILNVTVHPSHRRRGIGKALVSHLVSAGAAAGATVAGLEVRADNGAARALYEVCGFTCVGERRDYYGPGQHAVLMDCRLAATIADDRGVGVA